MLKEKSLFRQSRERVTKEIEHLQADSEDWSDCVDEQVDMSIVWVRISFCKFSCHSVYIISRGLCH